MDPLLALQDIDAQIDELNKEIKDIPARKEAEMAKLATAQNRLAAARDELVTAKTDADDLELQSQAAQENARKLKDQQANLKSEKSIQANESQLATSQNKQNELETAHLNALEAIPEAEKRVSDAQAFVDEESAEIADYIKELDERLEEAKSRVAALMEERKEAVKNVFPQHLTVYNRLRTSRKPTVVPLRDGVCGGCHLTQPPAVEHLVHRMDFIPVGDKRAALVACQMCGRLLYSEK